MDRPLAAADLDRVINLITSHPSPKHALALDSTNAQKQISTASFSGVRILAADDSPVNREVLSEVMRRLDVELVCVEDGLSVVETAKSGHFDLVFMDGSMPGLDGFEATRQIRDWERESGRETVPIVALTAQVVGAQGDRWREAGADDFVAKPFSLATIEACLCRHLDARKTPENTSEIEESRPCRFGPATEMVLLDAEVLQSIRDLQAPGDDLVERVIGLYLEHAPAALSRLAALGPDAAPDEIASTAHALKSLSRNVGALRVGDLAGAIEDSAESGTEGPSTQDLAELSAALDQTLEALNLQRSVAAAA